MANYFTSLMYHRVLLEKDPFCQFDQTTCEFEGQIRVLSRFFKFFTLRDALALSKENKLPHNALCITFDDGYMDFFSNALPILKKYGAPATLFVTTKCIHGETLWNDKLRLLISKTSTIHLDLTPWGLGKFSTETTREKIKSFQEICEKLKYMHGDGRQLINKICHEFHVVETTNLMLSESHIKEINSCGIEIGSHTVTHPILSKLNDDISLNEIFDSKVELESIIGEEVTSFAYPNGKPGLDYSDREIDLVKQSGYQCAASTMNGVYANGDVFQIPRFSPSHHTGLSLLLRVIKNQYFKK